MEQTTVISNMPNEMNAIKHYSMRSKEFNRTKNKDNISPSFKSSTDNELMSDEQSSELNHHQKDSESTEIILKERNLGPNGAYKVAKRIKKNTVVKTVIMCGNSFEDEGIIYLSLGLKLCHNISHLNLSNNLMTDYGIRILMENLPKKSLRYLDVSANPVGDAGLESLAKFLEGTKTLEHLNISSINLEDNGAKRLGVAISQNSSLKRLDISWNHIRMNGAALLAKGLTTNNSIEDLNLSYNGFAAEGALAIKECIRLNTSIKFLDLTCNRMNYECAVHISVALGQNRTLRHLNLSNNPLTTNGVYQLLNAINNENSGVEYLGLRNVAALKHVYFVIEVIQQKRKFVCDVGPIITYPDTIGQPVGIDDDPMMKLSKYLIEKRLRLIDMFRILDKRQTLRMEKEEFCKRLKIFEPRLNTKDIVVIADTLATGDKIEYSTLFRQVHQTRNEIIQQENAILRLRLQTVKKNRNYMNNIEKEFQNLMLGVASTNNIENGERTNHSINTSADKNKILTSHTIDSWLNEVENTQSNIKLPKNLNNYNKSSLNNNEPPTNRTAVLRSISSVKKLSISQNDIEPRRFKAKRLKPIKRTIAETKINSDSHSDQEKYLLQRELTESFLTSNNPTSNTAMVPYKVSKVQSRYKQSTLTQSLSISTQSKHSYLKRKTVENGDDLTNRNKKLPAIERKSMSRPNQTPEIETPRIATNNAADDEENNSVGHTNGDASENTNDEQ